MKTTLNEIRKYSPYEDIWKSLLTHLGKTKADDEPLSLLTVLDSNGLDDALWCLRAVTGDDREIRLYAVWCARQVQHLMTDQRSIEALDVAERHANGDATDDELAAAGEAAAMAAAMAVAGEAAAMAAMAAAWAAMTAAGEAAAMAAMAAMAAAWAAMVEMAAAGEAAAMAAQENEFRAMIGRKYNE